MKSLVIAIVVTAAACGTVNPLTLSDDQPDATVAISVAMPHVDSSCDTASPDRGIALSCYTCKHACAGDVPAYCTGTDWPAPAAACLKADPTAHAATTVYRWYEAGSDDPVAHQEYLRPFVLLGYMRMLRDAAGADPMYAPVLEAQISYVLGHSKTYVADATGPRSTVWQSYYVRASDSATRSYADALNQAGYAFYLLSVAKQYGAANAERRDHYVELAIQFDNAMERPYGNKTGGTLRVNADACGYTGLTGACWYFHSRAPENQWDPGTALNQSLYTLKVASDLLGELANPAWTTSWPTAPELDREAWRERLRDRIANAMSQWTYGAGNTATTPDAPPNLRQHARRNGTTSTYYWADYEFDMTAHVSLDNSVTHDHICNYHTVALNDLASLLENLDSNADGAGTPGAAYAQLGGGDRYQRIAKARAVFVTYTHNGGIIETTGVTGGNPLYQWFVSEVTPAIRQGQELCPAAGTSGTEALYYETKAYLCRKFGGAANPALATACAP